MRPTEGYYAAREGVKQRRVDLERSWPRERILAVLPHGVAPPPGTTLLAICRELPDARPTKAPPV